MTIEMSNAELREAIADTWGLLHRTALDNPRHDPLQAHFKALLSEQAKRAQLEKP